MEKIRYPRTLHLEWSEHLTTDDKIQTDLSYFEGKDIIITEKMDGENTTMYNSTIHARSLDSGHHPSRNYVKGIWGNIRHLIPDNFRICGENMYAEHSIFYDNLEDYFLVFSIWENDICLNWNDTEEYCKLFNLHTVPILYEGKFDKNLLENFHTTLDTTRQEGFVMRLKSSFKYSEFSKCVVKWVRKNHITTDEHWMTKPVVKNKLKLVTK